MWCWLTLLGENDVVVDGSSRSSPYAPYCKTGKGRRGEEIGGGDSFYGGLLEVTIDSELE